jgi:hypothetical protein
MDQFAQQYLKWKQEKTDFSQPQVSQRGAGPTYHYEERHAKAFSRDSDMTGEEVFFADPDERASNNQDKHAGGNPNYPFTE